MKMEIFPVKVKTVNPAFDLKAFLEPFLQGERAKPLKRAQGLRHKTSIKAHTR